MSIKLMKKRWFLETTDEKKDCNDVVDMDLEDSEKKNDEENDAAVQKRNEHLTEHGTLETIGDEEASKPTIDGSAEEMKGTNKAEKLLNGCVDFEIVVKSTTEEDGPWTKVDGEEDGNEKMPVEDNLVAESPGGNRKNVEKCMEEFELLKMNTILCDKSLIKEHKVMRCYCEPTREDILRRRGCGPGCINRELFTECGSRCPCGAGCSNKRFKNKEYANVEPFDAGRKGWGLRAVEPIQEGRFIIEYVGEVIDAKDMRRRLRKYGKDPKHVHHYFMALKNGAVIDATLQGNLSRFINHSCDPNCETQKWSVGGQLRIGFFALRPIAVGEEIVFDYQLERYGRRAQSCYCGAACCRGLIGQDSDSDEDTKNEEQSSEESEDSEAEVDKTMVDVVKKVEKTIVDGGDEKAPLSAMSHLPKTKANVMFSKYWKRKIGRRNIYEKAMRAALARGMPRNRAQVKSLLRIMVQVDQAHLRHELLSIFVKADDDILSLLLQGSGLDLLFVFLAAEYPADDERSVLLLKIATLELLNRMPIRNKNQIESCGLLSMISSLANTAVGTMLVVREVLERVVSTVCGETATTSSSFTIVRNGNVGDSLEKLSATLSTNAGALLRKWSALPLEYRIPRRDPNTSPELVDIWANTYAERVLEDRRLQMMRVRAAHYPTEAGFRRRIVPARNVHRIGTQLTCRRTSSPALLSELNSGRMAGDANSLTASPGVSLPMVSEGTVRAGRERSFPITPETSVRMTPEPSVVRRSRFETPMDEDASMPRPPPPVLLPESMFTGGLSFVGVPPIEFDWPGFYNIYDPTTLPPFAPYFPDFHHPPPPFQRPPPGAMNILEAPAPPAEPKVDSTKIANSWSITVDMADPTDEQIEQIETKLAEMKEVRESRKRKAADEIFGTVPPPPPPVSPPRKSKWIKATTDEGAVYFYHKETRVSSWIPPPEEGDYWADTTSDHSDARATFKAAVAKLVGSVLEPIRKSKFGSSEDYKNVLRKLTHTILEKEMKRIGGGELKVTESVKDKARRYVSDYITRLGDGQYCRKNKHHNAY